MTTETITDESTTTATEVLYYAYDASGSPLSLTLTDASGTESTYYYAVNIQGDVTAILTTSGTAVVEYTYDAWGNPLAVTGTLADTLGETNSLRYCGYIYDQETGYYYLRSRYYNPELGRFINADGYSSTGQGLLGNNMFAYCNNCPVLFADASGTRVVARLDIDGGGGSSAASPAYKRYDSIYDRKYDVYIVLMGQDISIARSAAAHSGRATTAVIVQDLRNLYNDGKPDPDMKIYDSYRIDNDDEQRAILRVLLQYTEEYPYAEQWTWDEDDLLYEWDYHNGLAKWNIAPSSTKDVDLNNRDRGVKAWERVFQGIGNKIEKAWNGLWR